MPLTIVPQVMLRPICGRRMFSDVLSSRPFILPVPFSTVSTSKNRVADSPRLGVDACVALHAGLDASAAFWILDLRFGFLDAAFP